MRGTLGFIVVVLLLATPAVAEDLWDPPWDMTEPTATHVHWNFPTDTEMPVELNNPYGDPVIEWPTTAAVEEIDNWEGIPITTWHIGGEPGSTSTISIWIPNHDLDWPTKYVFWQITADGSVSPTGTGPTTNPPGTSIPTGNPAIGHGGTWYTYSGLIEIRPNPAGEWLIIEVAQCTNIEEIVIDTICIPEPASRGLLALGGLTLLARLKRR